MPDDDATPGDTGRHLLRARDKAALASSLPPDGHPYASLVLVAADYDGSPILLISDLAEHARNITADDRVSLLFDGTDGLASALTGPRLSLQGRARRDGRSHLRQRFLARHPDAAGYADFGDFAVHRIAAERAHLVAGFGRIEWIDGADLLYPVGDCAGMAPLEAALVAEINDDHAAAVQNLAAPRSGGGGWMMTGCDLEGCDLRRGGETLRLPFNTPASDGDSLRRRLAELGLVGSTAR